MFSETRRAYLTHKADGYALEGALFSSQADTLFQRSTFS